MTCKEVLEGQIEELQKAQKAIELIAETASVRNLERSEEVRRLNEARLESKVEIVKEIQQLVESILNL